MSETTPVPSAHEWFRARIAPQAFGLLDDVEEPRFLAHARECPDCDEAMKVFARDSHEGARATEHVPARILARWDRASTRLRGMARRAVRAHLENCEACRQDLTLLGHVPTLEVIPELESEEGEAAVGELVAPPARPLRIIQSPAPSPATRRRWLAGGALAGALATAAGLIMVFRPWGDEPRGTYFSKPALTPPPAVIAPPVALPAAPVDDGVVLDVLSAPLALPSRTRGSGDSPPTLTLDAGARFLQLALPDLYLPEGTSVRLVLVGPDGKEIQRVERSAAALSGGRALLFGIVGRPLTPGLYRLDMTLVGEQMPPIATFEFRLVTARR